MTEFLDCLCAALLTFAVHATPPETAGAMATVPACQVDAIVKRPDGRRRVFAGDARITTDEAVEMKLQDEIDNCKANGG